MLGLEFRHNQHTVLRIKYNNNTCIMELYVTVNLQ
jgi:hypothetical protein